MLIGQSPYSKNRSYINDIYETYNHINRLFILFRLLSINMRLPFRLYPTILALLQFTIAARKPERVLLSKVKTLTLRKNVKTTHNRVAAVPQVWPDSPRTPLILSDTLPLT